MLQEDDRVRVADGGLEQALGVGRVIGRDHLQAGHVGVPGRIVLAVLGGHAGGRAVGAAEHDRALDLAAGHVERLAGRVDQLVHRLHGEVPGHELHDRLQPGHGRAHRHAGEAVLGDRGVDHAAVAELFQQAAADLVGALVLGDFLAHQEHVLVAAHLLGHGVAQGVADGRLDQLGPFRDGRIGQGLGDGRGGRRSRRSGRGLGLGGRSRRGSGLGRGRRRRGAAVQPGDQAVDLHAFGPFRDDDLGDDALVDGFHFHGRLVGLDLGDHLAGLDLVADLDVPLGQVALFHGRREGGHEDIDAH